MVAARLCFGADFVVKVGRFDDDEVVSLFGGDAVDAIALAQDEARMLGSSIVEPEHLLPAILRRDRQSEQKMLVRTGSSSTS